MCFPLCAYVCVCVCVCVCVSARARVSVRVSLPNYIHTQLADKTDISSARRFVYVDVISNDQRRKTIVFAIVINRVKAEAIINTKTSVFIYYASVLKYEFIQI